VFRDDSQKHRQPAVGYPPITTGQAMNAATSIQENIAMPGSPVFDPGTTRKVRSIITSPRSTTIEGADTFFTPQQSPRIRRILAWRSSDVYSHCIGDRNDDPLRAPTANVIPRRTITPDT
jgi:hypothetical protein